LERTPCEKLAWCLKKKRPHYYGSERSKPSLQFWFSRNIGKRIETSD
jgi:hypothetical protein